MRKRGGRLFAGLLCALLGAALLSPGALAAGGDNSLVLNYFRNGVRFDVYRAADIDPAGGYTLTGDFKNYAVALPGEGWRDAAATLAAYADRDDLTPAASGVTVNGSVTFPGLEDGLYLVMGNTSTEGGDTYTPVPFLTAVSDGRSVTARVKFDQTGGGGGGPDYAAFTVTKVWKGGRDGETPAGVTIQLLRDGTEYDRVTLDSSNDWTYTWAELDVRHRWQITEADVPEGYTVSVSRSGQTFLVTNTYQTPGEPDGPEDSGDPNAPGDPGLPQTGQLWWPVLPLSLCGGGMVLVGMLRRRDGFHDDEG